MINNIKHFNNIWKIMLSAILALTICIPAIPTKAFAAMVSSNIQDINIEIHSGTTKHVYLGYKENSSTLNYTLEDRTDSRIKKDAISVTSAEEGGLYYYTADITAGDYSTTESNTWVYRDDETNATITLTVKKTLEETDYPFYDEDTITNDDTATTNVYVKLADMTVRFVAPTQIGFKTAYDSISEGNTYYNLYSKNFALKNGAIDEQSGPYFKNLSDRANLQVTSMKVEKAGNEATPVDSLSTLLSTTAIAPYYIDTKATNYVYWNDDSTYHPTEYVPVSFTKLGDTQLGSDEGTSNPRWKMYAKTSNKDYIGLAFGLNYADSEGEAAKWHDDTAGVAKNIQREYNVYAKWYNGLKTQVVTWNIDVFSMQEGYQ